MKSVDFEKMIAYDVNYVENVYSGDPMKPWIEFNMRKAHQNGMTLKEHQEELCWTELDDWHWMLKNNNNN